MRFWKSWGISAVLLVALIPMTVQAASLSGRASTVLEWFDNADEDTAIGAYQYLNLNARDLPGGLTFQGYGRVAEDLKNEVDIDSRLYYAYLDKQNLIGNLDARLGRQFVATTAGASLLDGLKLDYDGLGPFALSLYGGGDVSYYEGYDSKDWLAGVEGSFSPFKSLKASLSYLQQWEEGELAKELIGFDFDYDIKQSLNLYSEVQYSWLTDEVTYFLAGANFHRSRNWSLRGEYLYSLPVFSSTSIYSVFATSEYQEASLEATYRLTKGLRTFVRLSNEFYDEFDDAQVAELGIEKLRSGKFSGYLVGTWRDDEEGQDLYGAKVRAAYLLHPKFEAGVGAHIDVLERRLDDDDETTSSRVWADFTSHLTRTVSLQGKVERIESDLWSEYYRGRVRLNISF
ncbi:MAG: hypothetical protein C0624_06470 [Desulfuromonas sp.]|nr:MAG: hypothetical protein C0624_06470 [Desulfuromonas sp.]